VRPQDRESKLKDQVADYEGQVAQYKIQLQQRGAGAGTTTPAKHAPGRASGTPPSVRAPSPASTSRSATPVLGEQGVYSSMHAPKTRYAGVIARPAFRAPSPTLSIVSAAPTLGADGWWE
jgi:hypothetical protein